MISSPNVPALADSENVMPRELICTQIVSMHGDRVQVVPDVDHQLPNVYNVFAAFAASNVLGFTGRESPGVINCDRQCVLLRARDLR